MTDIGFPVFVTCPELGFSVTTVFHPVMKELKGFSFLSNAGHFGPEV